MAETVDHAVRIHAESLALARLDEGTDLPRLELPTLIDGVDLGSLYELTEELVAQGVGAGVPV